MRLASRATEEDTVFEQRRPTAEMGMSSIRKLGWVGSLGLATMAALVSLAPSVARADGPASPTGKGIAGGILLGAEVVMIPIAIGGIEDAWPYPVFGALGAAGGGIGGYFVEQTGSAEASVYMLAGGMALVIPTVVAVLNVTLYGTEDNEEDSGSSGETTTTPIEGGAAKPAAAPAHAPSKAPAVAPPAEPGGAPPAVTPAPPVQPTAMRHRHRRSMPLALVGVDARGIRPGVPAIGLQPLYSETEIAQFGVKQGTEVRVPVVSGTF